MRQEIRITLESMQKATNLSAKQLTYIKYIHNITYTYIHVHSHSFLHYEY